MKNNDKDFGYSISLQCPECNKETETLSVDHEASSGVIIISLCKKCDIRWKTTIRIERDSVINDTINRINRFRG